MWRTDENMILTVIKNNSERGYESKKQTDWLIKRVEKLQDELARQRKHEDYLLEELKKLGWFDNLF